jgi:RNA polymerase sigma factor (sigma-70 family)
MASAASEWVTTGERGAIGDFERLFMREHARVVAIAYRVLGDGAAAEDVAQEVFCSFYQRHSPDAPYAAPWLHRAAAHTALNIVRGARRRQERERREAVDRQRVQASAETSLDPQRSLELEEERREVRAALGRLPAKSASVLVLRYSGLSYAEIAAALGIGPGQVGTLLRRAETALRKELQHETQR